MASSSSTAGPPSGPSTNMGLTITAPAGMEDRMFFSRETGTWRFEDDDGNEMEYDTSKNAWAPVVRAPYSSTTKI